VDPRIAEAVGDVMLLLHTRARGEAAPLLEPAIARFALTFVESGATKQATIDLLQGLVDQAVASADISRLPIARIADELQRDSIVRCARLFDVFLDRCRSPDTPAGPAHFASRSAMLGASSAEIAIPSRGPRMELRFAFTSGIVTVRLGGRYGVEDGQVALRAVLPDPTAIRVRGTVIDLRESTDFPKRSRAELESVGTYVATLREELGGRLAIVVRDQVGYGLSRVLAAWAGVNGLPVRSFFDERGAIAWLSDEEGPDAA
jgi:hypothetical protein